MEVSLKPDALSGLGQNRFQNAFMSTLCAAELNDQRESGRRLFRPFNAALSYYAHGKRYLDNTSQFQHVHTLGLNSD